MSPLNAREQALFETVQKKTNDALSSGHCPIAAFDADGTLWKHDIGEDFFLYQIQNSLLPHLSKDAWSYYKNLYHHTNTLDALTWLAKINQGHSLETLSQWLKNFLELHPPPLIPLQQKIIHFFQEMKIEIFVVTASVQWVVESAASLYGIPSSHILGVRTEVIQNLITDIPITPITWKEGKAVELLKKTKGRKPFFSSGNSMGDLALLETATHFALTLHLADSTQDVYHSEQDLFTLSRQKPTWLQYGLQDLQLP